ncbi:Fe2+-dicitrate sensor, membrane component [Sphingopyxis fribergensis]|uniref:Fe2+-dicitrate sensor, membrane component n=1 Tax=Sphingopyxis fribergensis TaxID=1515612 RepID=A0A0A7PMC9_9SPHN|nr:FecR domain-containing protein [Sphingopyxis fribergensis]AJA09087.1 Fe2+-dicitrate sensor, membrane component [Sphingopyxis fribergensis]
MAEDEDAAVRWAIRRDRGQLDTSDQIEFDAWLAEDGRRSGALLRAEAALVYLDRARALGEPGAEAPANDDAPAAHPRFRRRKFLLASFIVAPIAAGLAMFMMPSNEAFSTTVGEVRKLPLADGSIATVNTASRITVTLEPAQRHVVVEDGEAWFEVAHDKSRPFIVDAGDVRVKAIGTAFSVRRHEDGVDVLVTKGVVETWRVGRESERTRLKGGQRSFVPVSASKIVAVAADDEIERALAWRSGGLALNGEPLSYAVAELNRYNRHQLVVEDPVLSRTPIVGYFRTDNPEGFAKSIAALIGARVELTANQTRLVPSGT